MLELPSLDIVHDDAPSVASSKNTTNAGDGDSSVAEEYVKGDGLRRFSLIGNINRLDYCPLGEAGDIIVVELNIELFAEGWPFGKGVCFFICEMIDIGGLC